MKPRWSGWWWVWGPPSVALLISKVVLKPAVKSWGFKDQGWKTDRPRPPAPSERPSSVARAGDSYVKVTDQRGEAWVWCARPTPPGSVKAGAARASCFPGHDLISSRTWQEREPSLCHPEAIFEVHRGFKNTFPSRFPTTFLSLA